MTKQPVKKTRTKKGEIPRILHLKSKNLAYIIIDGRKHYLGTYGSHQAEVKRLQVWSDHIAGRDRPSRTAPIQSVTIAVLVKKFLEDAKTTYVKNGRSTGTYERFEIVVVPLLKHFGLTAAERFGPLALKKLRQIMVDSGRLARKTINSRIDGIRQIFRWGVENELVEADTWKKLTAVVPLKPGKTDAIDYPPVPQVPLSDVIKTIQAAHPVLGDMIRVQLLAGMRPGEVRLMRPCDIDRSDDIWVYVPSEHKTEHKGKFRAIPIVPDAQSILAKYLDESCDSPEAYLFSPKVALQTLSRERRAKRKNKVQPSQQGRRKGRGPGMPIGDHYTKDSYCIAVKRAARRAGVADWSPNQLRHTRATDVESSVGMDAAQILLGHSSPEVTKIYLDPDSKKKEQIEKVKEVARKIVRHKNM